MDKKVPAILYDELVRHPRLLSTILFDSSLEIGLYDEHIRARCFCDPAKLHRGGAGVEPPRKLMIASMSFGLVVAY